MLSSVDKHKYHEVENNEKIFCRRFFKFLLTKIKGNFACFFNILKIYFCGE